MIIQKRPDKIRILCGKCRGFLMEAKKEPPKDLGIVLRCYKCHRDIKLE